MERWCLHAEGGHDGSESRCEIERARKFNDVAGGGAHKVGKSRGGVGVEVRKMREVSQARGFAIERFHGAREEDLGQDRAGARALKQQDQLGG